MGKRKENLYFDIGDYAADCYFVYGSSERPDDNVFNNCINFARIKMFTPFLLSSLSVQVYDRLIFYSNKIIERSPCVVGTFTCPKMTLSLPSISPP